MAPRLSLLLTFLVLPACGSTVVPGEAADGGVEAAADTGTVVSETGPDVPAVETGLCARTNDRLTIVATGRHTLGCSIGTRDAGIPGPMTGQIVRVDATSFDLDTCPPTADCVPLITTFKVTAPGLDLRGMREKSYVEVTYTESFFFGCSTSIVVRSVDTWTGVKNPADVGGKIYLAGGDGDDPTLPFAIDKVRQHCLPEGTPTCGGSAAPDHYAYRFAGTATIGMGETTTFTAAGQKFEARNLRAYYLGWCDEYWDYAFWLTSAKP
ncbi:MAG: hypothetical protein IPJ34_37700 [Myxococcales bacterium]|nr:hypothetical protein [Myxococcales bacterium]